MKGVVIYQVDLLTEIAEKMLNEMKFYFKSNIDTKIDIFFLQEVTPKNIRHLTVKITCDNLRKAQVRAIPIFRYLSLLELASTTFSSKKYDMHIDPGTDPTLHIKEQSFQYSKIFST